MGFDSGIYRYPKYNLTTPHELGGVEDYLSYFENDWANKNFDSPEKYCAYTEHEVPTQDMIDFYKPFFHKDEYGIFTIQDNICWWCSNGIWLHELIFELFKERVVDDHLVILDKDDVIKLLLKAIDRFMKFKLEFASIDHSFIYEYNDEDEVDSIVLKKCDGVELTFDDDSIKRVYTSSEYEGEICTFKENVCLDDFYSTLNTLDNLKKVLETTDFENNVVYYSGGW